MFFVFSIVAYFTAPLVSFIVNAYLHDKENFSLRIKERPGKSATLFSLFFVLDNILVFGTITILKGRINVLEYMKVSSKFVAAILIISSIIGVFVPVILNSLKGKKFPLQINSVSSHFNEKLFSNFAVYAIGLIGIILCLLQCYDNNLWGDEAYSILHGAYANSFLEAAKGDWCHPPFYYVFLRALAVTFGHYPFVYHLATAIATILLLIFSMTFVKKNIGAGASVIFSLMLTMTRPGRYFAVEIRDYEWAGLFVAFCLYEGYQLLRAGGGKRINWILFCIGGLGAAYSHYFALAGIILIYFFVFLRLVIMNRKNLIRCLIATIVTILGYAPWVGIFITNVVKVTVGGFWIRNVVSVKDGFNYIFDSPKVFWIFLALMAFSIIYVYGIVNISWDKSKFKISFFSGKKDDSLLWTAITATLATYGIFLFEILYGSITTPVFVHRYIYPVGVALWLAFATLLMNLPFAKLRKCLYVLLAAFLIFTYWPSFSSGIFHYFRENKTTQASVKMIQEKLGQADHPYIFTNIGWANSTSFVYYFPNATIEWADVNKDYYFEKGTNKIILLLSKELDENQRRDWENNLRAKLRFVNQSAICYYRYYLYEADRTRR